MVHIYYHIYAFRYSFDIVKEQITYIQNSFKCRPKVNIIILAPSRQDIVSGNDSSHKIYEWLTKEILPIENDYVIRDFLFHDVTTLSAEWNTLDFIIKDKELFADDDSILYIHTKGASHQSIHLDIDVNNLNRDDAHRFYYEKNSVNWKRTMEYYLIEKNQECIDILNKTEYNTVGTFLNEPFFFCEVYAGNYFWMSGKYAKTLLTNPNESDIDKKSRSTAEFQFINTGIDWKPYSIFNIPWDKFGTEKFYKLLKQIENEN
jgi:hypothetical protein